MTKHVTITAETQIRALIGQWVEALRAKDAAGVGACFAPPVTHFSLAPPLKAGEGIEGLQSWFDTWQGPIGYDIRDLDVTADEHVAFCHALSHLTGEKVHGERADVWFRLTVGLRKAGPEWRITHEHASVPFYMDGSFRAATDLKP